MTVGFSGHIDLSEKDYSKLKQLLVGKLAEVKKVNSMSGVLVGNAQGADQVLINAAKELNIPVRYLEDEVMRSKQETDGEYYQKQINHLITTCGEFVVVWDGIFTEKPGGTSWLVRELMEHEEQHTLHHLITPRESNPYPISALNAKGLLPAGQDLDSKLPWVPAFHWVSFLVGGSKTKSASTKVKRWSPFSHSLWRSFIVPGVFAVLTLAFGVIGFAQESNSGLLDNFFKSINLLTLNGLVINDPNIFLDLARFTGILTPFSAIAFGLYAASSGLRMQQTLKNWMKHSNKFVVITGDNTKAIDLAFDLADRNYKVLLIDLDNRQDKLNRLNRNVFQKRCLPELQKTEINKFFSKAGLIYLMDNEDHNLQMALAINDLSQQKNTSKLKTLFVHLNGLDTSKFLHDNVSEGLRNKLKIINLQRNTVRRLFNYFPIDDGNNDNQSISIHLIGYNSLSIAICEYIFSQLHIEKEKKFELTIHAENPAQAEASFYDLFGFLRNREESANIERYVWKNWQINFVSLSLGSCSYNRFLSGLNKEMNEQKCLNVYLCSPNSSQSISWVSTLLPRLNQLKLESKQSLKLFCYFNHPDKERELQIERSLNKLAPNLFLTCFGNLLDECSYAALNEDSLDSLAIEIAAWYDRKYGSSAIDPLTSWNQSSFQDKRANRQAADHIWLKWRWLLRNSTSEWTNTKEALKAFSNLDRTQLERLSEIEHRRWCADLVTQGFHVLPERYDADWEGNKPNLKKQLYHRDLIPFFELSEKDKEKDMDQIHGIPEFIFRTFE